MAMSDGYELAFYELAKIMGIGARPASPGHVWRSEMLPRILQAFPAEPLSSPSDDLHQAREEGYRAGYKHVLSLTRTGVPTSDFERDVGAYMADFVRRRV